MGFEPGPLGLGSAPPTEPLAALTGESSNTWRQHDQSEVSPGHINELFQSEFLSETVTCLNSTSCCFVHVTPGRTARPPSL